MIISCINCNKKFNVDANLIPEKGRLLQCSSCNHEWFFSTNERSSAVEEVKADILDNIKKNDNKKITIFNEDVNTKKKKQLHSTKIVKEVVTKKIRNKNNILNFTVVFIISFIALVILLDTFKSPLSKIIPNIEFLLYNLYESTKDILLFIHDLI